MKTHSDDQKYFRLFVLLMLMICMALMFSCKVKKRISKNSKSEQIKTEQQTETKVNSLERSASSLMTDLQGFRVGETIIYPRGEFVFSDGTFQGEADSVVTSNKSQIEVKTIQRDTTIRETEITQETEKKQETEIKTKDIQRDIDKDSQFIGAFLLFCLFVSLIWFIRFIRNYRP